MVSYTTELPAALDGTSRRVDTNAIERDEFRKMVVDEMGALYHTALRLARNPDDALDLTQESCFRALRAEASFELRDRGVRPWMVRILRNVFYTKVARKRLEPVLIDSMELNAATDDEVVAGRCLDMSTLDWEQVDERLKRAIQALPEHYSQVFLLWAVEGLRYRQIADVLSIPAGTVMSRLHRARAILSEQLHDLAAEQGMTSEGQSSLT